MINAMAGPLTADNAISRDAVGMGAAPRRKADGAWRLRSGFGDAAPEWG